MADAPRFPSALPLSEHTGFVLRQHSGRGPAHLYLVFESWGRSNVLENSAAVQKLLYRERQVRCFCVEGFWGRSTAALLRRAYALQKLDPARLLRAAQIPSNAYLATTSNASFDVIGVDDESMHAAQHSAYQAARGCLRHVEPFLRRARTALGSARRDYSAPWREVYSITAQQFGADDGHDIGAHCDRLTALARELGLVLDTRRLLGPLREATRLEAADDPGEAWRERAELAAALRTRLADGLPDAARRRLSTRQLWLESVSADDILRAEHGIELDVPQRAADAIERQLARPRPPASMPAVEAELLRDDVSLARLLGVDLSAYPALWRRHRLLAIRQWMKRHLRRPQDHVERLGGQLLRQATDGGRLWRLLTLERDLARLSALFAAELSPDDARTVDRIRHAYPFDELVRRLDHVGAKVPEDPVFSACEQIWDLGLIRAARFYRYSELRALGMLRATEAELARRSPPVAALVVGGFHRLTLEREIARRGELSFTDIAPVADPKERWTYHETMGT